MADNRKFFDNDYLNLVIRLFVGVIFIYAAIDKVANPAQFARIVYNYHLLPTSLINLFAIVMPWVEIICGATLILGVFRPGGVLLANLLILSFIIALSVNLFRGVDIECGCFTVSSKAKGGIIDLLLRDAGLLILALYLLFSRSRRFSLMKS
ncbi:DoxX family protein [Candidatus Zixiibacteriota bacterium]|nr:DoxX family protein [candidate division Zixibacteria bacterium]